MSEETPPQDKRCIIIGLMDTARRKNKRLVLLAEHAWEVTLGPVAPGEKARYTGGDGNGWALRVYADVKRKKQLMCLPGVSYFYDSQVYMQSMEKVEKLLQRRADNAEFTTMIDTIAQHKASSIQPGDVQPESGEDVF